ncbi:unnamed protein product [Symbiodinium sp. CCMP2592]|nr:unnamed protein product [Symbiodinium sp. CCMP2592]
MALPKAWDEIMEGASAMVQKVAQREKQVNEALAKGDQRGLTKQQVVEALVTYHSEHGSQDDPCTLSDFKFSPDTLSVEGIQAKGKAALERKNHSTASALAESGRVSSVKAASLAQDPGAEEKALLDVRRELEHVKSRTKQLLDLDPDQGKSRNEVLKSSHAADVVKNMRADQKSVAFREIARSRIVERRAKCSEVADQILHASKRPMKLEDIYAAAAVAETMKTREQETAVCKTELDNVSQSLKDHLSTRKLQMEACEKIRQKSAEDKAKAASDLRKVLDELARVAPAYTDAVTKLQAQDAALDVLQDEITSVESKLEACTDAAALAGADCQGCCEALASAEEALRNDVSVAATAVLQHGPKPCTIAFENILLVQALLSRAEGEVATELQDLQDAKGRLQGELDRTRQLWNQGQTTHRVSERSAGLRDDVEAVQCDIEDAAAAHEQLKTRIGKAAAQKDSFLELAHCGFVVDEAAFQSTEAHALVDDAYGDLKIMSMAPAAAEQLLLPQDASGTSALALQQQMPDIKTLIQEAINSKYEQMNVDFKLWQEDWLRKNGGSDAGSWTPVEEP